MFRGLGFKGFRGLGLGFRGLGALCLGFEGLWLVNCWVWYGLGGRMLVGITSRYYIGGSRQGFTLGPICFRAS